MQDLILLSDGSVHAQSKIGYGAYLAVPEPGLSLEELRSQVRVRRFTQTSSTKLELQTLLWALSDLHFLGGKVMIYTDSQNIINLPGRREQLQRQARCPPQQGEDVEDQFPVHSLSPCASLVGRDVGGSRSSPRTSSPCLVVFLAPGGVDLVGRFRAILDS